MLTYEVSLRFTVILTGSFSFQTAKKLTTNSTINIKYVLTYWVIQTSQKKGKFHNSKSTYTSTCAALTIALCDFRIHIQKDMELLIEKEIIVRIATFFINSQHRSGPKAAAFSYWSHHVTEITDEIFFKWKFIFSLFYITIIF